MGTGKTYSTKYLLDSNNSSGVAGQVLSTTSTGIDWVDSGTLSTGLWLKNGNNIYNSNSGNVGVGTTGPTAKLHVLGGSNDTIDETTANFKVQGGGGNGTMFGTIASSPYTSYIQSAYVVDTSLAQYNLALNPIGGNVGIGTTSPTAPLDVNGVIRSRGGTYIADLDTRTNVGLVIPENDFIYTADGSSYLRKLIGKTSDVITIGESGTSLIDGINLLPGTTGGYVQVYNNGSVAAKFVDGKLGVGTTLPTTALTIRKSISPTAYGGEASMIEFKSYYTGYDTETVKSAIYSGVSDQTGLQTARGFMSFWTSSYSATGVENLTEKMRIESDGNVGVGTTSPSRKLVVSGAADGIIQSNDTTGAGSHLRILADVTAQNVINWDKDTALRFATSDEDWANYNERMRIDDIGAVLIGGQPKIDTATKLQVGGNDSGVTSIWSNADDIVFEHNTNLGLTFATPNDAAATIAFADPQSVQAGWIQYLHDVDAMRFGTNGNSERMRISSVGNVGIGTTNPGAKFVVTDNNDGQDTTFRVNHTRSNSNVATQAVEVSMTLSGADTTTADRINSGILATVVSTADGDDSNEHRLYGVYSNVTYSGMSDLVRGGYFKAESNNNTEKTAQTIGVYGQAVHDASSADGGVATLAGVYGQASLQDTGDVSNTYGGFFLADIPNTRITDVKVVKGVEGHIDINKQTAISYGNMSAVSAVIDNNEGSVPSFSGQYLFKGDYQGTKGSNAYGIYTEGDKNYFTGSIGIGIANPVQPLHVVGNAKVTGAYYDSNNSPGVLNQVLRSTVTGTDWVDGSAIPGVPGGSGTLNTIPLWTPDGDTLGNSIITQPSTGVVRVSGDSVYFSVTDTSAAARNIDIGHWVSGQTNIESQGGTLSIGTQSNHNIVFETNGSTKATILSGGNVGIGVTSPDFKLQIATPAVLTNSTYSWPFDLTRANSNTRGFSIGVQSGGGPVALSNHNGDILLGQTFGVDANGLPQFYETMRVKHDGTASSGKVGIGTTNPNTGKLVVAGAAYSISSSGQSLGGIDLKANANGGAGSYSAGISFGGASSGRAAISGVMSSASTDGDRQGLAFFTHGSGTGAADSIERMRLDSSGNFGIGTDNPVQTLQVNGQVLFRTTTVDGGKNRFQLIPGGSSDAANLYLYYGNTGDGTLSVRINAQGDSYLNGGNVGIGTTLPKTSLDIVKDSDIWHLMVGGSTKKLLVGGQAVSGDVVLQAGAASTVNNAAVTTPYNLCLQRDGGNVGINTPSPTEGKLVVVGKTALKAASVSEVALRIQRSSSTGRSQYTLETESGSEIWRCGMTGSGSTDYGFFDGVQNAITIKYRDDILFTPAGNVGIRKTNPAVPLDVEGKIRSNDSNSGDYLEIFCDGSVSGDSYIENTSNNIQIKSAFATSFSTSGSVAMFINNSQNVGIGTTSPNAPLQFSNAVTTRKVVLYEMANNNNQFYGFGVEAARLVYSTANTGDDHVFYAGASSTSRNELIRIDGSNGDIKLSPSSRIILDDTPAASTASGSGTIVNWSVSESTTAGTLYTVKSNGGWTTTDADTEAKSIGMLAIALGSNATAGMLLQGFFYKASHGFTIGLPLYISNTAGAFSTTRPTGTNDYVRIIGYATSANYIYFDPDKTWVKLSS